MGGRRRARTRAAAGLVALIAASALAADQAVTCKTSKMVRAGTYDLCVLKATAAAAEAGGGGAGPLALRREARRGVGEARSEVGGPLPDLGRRRCDRRAGAERCERDRGRPDAADRDHTVRRRDLPGVRRSVRGRSHLLGAGERRSDAVVRVSRGRGNAVRRYGRPGAAGATCGGACPDGAVCSTLGIDDTTLSATCGCVPAGSTPCISSLQPTCGGTCPSGLGCGADPLGLFSCVCQ